ncbi:MFS transporter [Paenibacillus sp. GCM10027627]|uniref:MFS transporter n=1 Tax=unclassified Paenibacillus TaxID=185978 RepID=UPI00363A87F4
MNKKYMVCLVSAAAFLGPFTQTIYTPILPEMAEQFRTTQDAVNLTVSVYPIFFAMMQLVYGPLIDKYGRRKLLLLGLLFYLVATAGAALSHSVTILILFRVLQAIGVSVGSVAATTIIGDLYEGKLRGRAMGIFQMFVALGPGLGPLIGGFTGPQLGFHGLFWILFAASMAFWAVLFASLPETKKEGSGKANRFQLRHSSGVLVHPVGLAIVMLGSVQYGIFYTLLILLPNLLQEVYSLGPSATGMMFLAISASIVIGSIVGGRIQEYGDTKKTLWVIAFCQMLSLLFLAFAAPWSLTLFAAGIVFFGICLGLTLPMQTTLLSNEFPERRATSIGVYNFFRYIWMSIGPVAGTYFYRFGYQWEMAAFAVVFAAVLLIIYRSLFRSGAILSSAIEQKYH